MPRTVRVRPHDEGARQIAPAWHAHGTALVAVTRTGEHYWQVYVRECPNRACGQPHFHRTKTPLLTMTKTGPCGVRYMVHLHEAELAA